MIYDVKFQEHNHSFNVEFNEVKNISDGGYERGLEEGQKQGYASGYAEGETNGYESGYGVGKQDGYTEGYTDGVSSIPSYEGEYEAILQSGETLEFLTKGKVCEENIVVSAASDSFYDTFWDGFQGEGNRTDYGEAFGSEYTADAISRGGCLLNYWTNEMFKPKYDLKPTTAQGMFRGYYGSNSDFRTPTSFLHGDLVELLEKAGITLDFSQATNVWNVFLNSNFTRLGVINFSAVTYNHSQFFDNCCYLETIDEFIPPKAILTGRTSDVFYNCSVLKNLTLGGNLLQDTNIGYSPLTLTSAISVITHLENYIGTENEYVYTITFSPTTWGYLDAEGETASPNSNSWREYINDLGWNAS